MKKTLLMVAVAMMTAMSVQAQDLAGRTYYNANILAAEMNKMMTGLDEKLDSARIEALDKAKKEKGRELTDDEKAEVDMKVKEAQNLMLALRKGMKTAITVEFKKDKKAVMKADLQISEDVLKAAGISWLKRKAMKAALAVAPSSMKATYEVKGDLVILNEDGELDTLRMSADGKNLSGTFEGMGSSKKPTKFTLTRTK